MLDLLFKCFRDSVFAWFNNQSNFIIIQNFDKDLACAFSIFIEFASKTLNQSFITSISISNSSSQYHSCVECFAHFSSMSRLLEHTQFHCTNSQVICKHCNADFNFKNKFHEHIREHHAQKFVISIVTSKNSNFRALTLEFTYKIMKKSAVVCSFVSSIFAATFTSISESISSKCSHLSIATFNITSKSMKKLSVNSFTSTISFFRTSVRKHQELHIQKFYFIIDDLIRRFHEKSKSFDLHSHRKCFVSSQRFDIRSFSQSRSFYQSRITFYFMFAVNQKTSISQISKSSNSKSFQQHTFAKSIRFVSALSKNSIFSLYKKSNIFYISLQSKFSLRFSFAWFTFSSTFSFTFSSFFRFRISDYVCCICFDHFSFRNDSFNYSRSSQRYFSNRRSMKEVKEMISRFETKLKKNEK